MHELEAFVETAAEYCAWAEGLPKRTRSKRLRLPSGCFLSYAPGCMRCQTSQEIATAVRLLSQLCARVHEVPDLFHEEDAPDVTHDQWLAIYTRFGSLPFNYYAVCSDPHDVQEPDPGVGDLADDLADIWRDLKGGLVLYAQGNTPAAAWTWRNPFTIHWGRHATSALYALLCWRF